MQPFNVRLTHCSVAKCPCKREMVTVTDAKEIIISSWPDQDKHMSMRVGVSGLSLSDTSLVWKPSPIQQSVNLKIRKAGSNTQVVLIN